MRFLQRSALNKNPSQFKLILHRLLLIIIVLILIQIKGFSNENNGTVNRIFTLIYNQQFEKADSMLSVNEKVIDPFYSAILKTDLYWWKYSISRSSKDAKELNHVLDNLNSESNNSVEKKVTELIQKSYKMRYERKRYNIIGVIFIRKEINFLLQELKKEKLPLTGNELKLFNLYVAIFQYFEFVNPFSFHKNSEEQNHSIKLMEKYAKENDIMLNTLSNYFLGRIYQKIEKDYLKAKTSFEVLSANFAENEIFKEYVEECKGKL